MTLFCDYYSANTPPATVRAAGFGGVILYISHQLGKCVTPESAAAARDGNLEVLLVFEDSATQAINGHEQGVLDAAFANAVADAVGYPPTCPIFYAVDFDATTFAAIDQYFAGCHTAGGRPVGVYGGIGTVNAVMASANASVAWQTLAWSTGRVSAYAALYQAKIAEPFDTDQELKPVTSWGGTTPLPTAVGSPSTPAMPAIPPRVVSTWTDSDGVQMALQAVTVSVAAGAGEYQTSIPFTSWTGAATLNGSDPDVDGFYLTGTVQCQDRNNQLLVTVFDVAEVKPSGVNTWAAEVPLTGEQVVYVGTIA